MLEWTIAAGLTVVSPMLMFSISRCDALKHVNPDRSMKSLSSSERTCLSIIRVDTKLLLDFANTAATLLGDKSHQLSTNVFDVVVLL